jgi:hypothetical protein
MDAQEFRQHFGMPPVAGSWSDWHVNDLYFVAYLFDTAESMPEVDRAWVALATLEADHPLGDQIREACDSVRGYRIPDILKTIVSETVNRVGAY